MKKRKSNSARCLLIFQSSVSMYLVIGHERLREYFSDDTLENWFMAYVDLLQRFQLVNQATQVIKISKRGR